MIDLDENLALDGTGDLAVVEGAEQLQSHIKARLLHVLGEDFFGVSLGVPWFDGGIFDLGTSYEQKAGILKSVVARTPGVVSVLEFSFGVARRERRALVEYRVRTVYNGIMEGEVLA